MRKKRHFTIQELKITKWRLMKQHGYTKEAAEAEIVSMIECVEKNSEKAELERRKREKSKPKRILPQRD